MNVKLKEGHVLTAYCRRPSGEATYSELDLDEFLGTRKGRLHENCLLDSFQTDRNLHIGQFAWGCQNFSTHSSDVDLQMEGPTHEPVLHAQLDDGVGNIQACQVNLAACIKNEDGHLRFMECF